MAQRQDPTLSWSGEKIKDLRRRLGWSQAELSNRLGCRQQTVSEWETNVYQPQNAYSQLLDRIFEDAQNFKIPAKKPAEPATEARLQHIEEKSETSFDSFID